jgi:hypothetical protein
MKTTLFMIAPAFFDLSCTDLGISPDNRNFNVKLRYGILARNELNTFQNTYTKDLILDGTITVPIVVSDEKLLQIRNKMDEIGFVSYPDPFVITQSGRNGISRALGKEKKGMSFPKVLRYAAVHISCDLRIGFPARYFFHGSQ